MISPATEVISTALQSSLGKQAGAAEKIADPRQVADVDDVIQFKQAELAAKIQIAVLKKLNATAGQLIDIVT